MSRRRSQTEQALRVAVLTPGLGLGGAERWVVSLCRHFSKRIYVVGIFSLDTNGPLCREANAVSEVFPMEDFELLKQVDVVIAWGLPKLPEFLKNFHGRVIGVSHGTPALEWSRVCAAHMLETPRMELAAVSHESAKTWGVGRKVTVIRNGAEVDRCTPAQPAHVVMHEFGIPQGKKLALYFGRISDEKRVGLFIGAASHLPDWHFLVCGDVQGDLPDSIPGNVQVLPPQERPGDLLGIADVFVLPSATEGHPLALTEAWLAGVPTVWCEWPLAEELASEFYDPEMGSIVPLNVNSEELAGHIEAAHRNHLSNPAGVIATRDFAWEHFTAAAMAARWEDYLFFKPVD